MHLVEHQLQDGVERILRGGGRPGWALLAIHLSRIEGGALAYHRRITAALLDDVAERCSGQLFGLGNGDIALLFRPPDDGAAVLTLVAHLFHGAAADPAVLRSLWPLPAASSAALGYIRARIQHQLDRPTDHAPGSPPVTPAHTRIRAAALPDLVERRTAVRLAPGTTRRIEPIFREIRIGDTVLAMDLPADELGSGTITGQLDRRVLAAAAAELPGGGVVTGGAAGGPRLPIHLNLTLTAVLSEQFARFAAAAAAVPGLTVQVGVPFSEVFADTATFVIARERLRLAGMLPVLDQVTHHALSISRPEALDPALLKLGWVPAMADLPGVAETIRRLGPERIVLDGCAAEAALVWGLSLGIQQFQGGFVDRMLAVERLRSCAAAPGCTMGGCRERAATLHLATRAGCRNLRLLDAGLAPGPA